jgi:hypothetical protein
LSFLQLLLGNWCTCHDIGILRVTALCRAVDKEQCFQRMYKIHLLASFRH